jgi:acyl-CoA reductase-like NAD-dependent aldehyde dehydrogenase
VSLLLDNLRLDPHAEVETALNAARDALPAAKALPQERRAAGLRALAGAPKGKTARR